ncbi:Gfo/Idh/MocA family protein [Teredinibacter haidensis]|uniref:Gfo/Idh/MocA family protein n=1 Tax=Teredinibacter haidensis TaxID=2731755 RepID=UPI000948C33E|nr:Gfo/Idh/MocA family oxidoreductase [Teredinibacter haidensis]
MSKRPLRWGILSTAKIAREKLIPALNASTLNEVVAVASRTDESAAAFAREQGFPQSYGDYQHLLDADDIDIVYNPLPNHLHIPWTVKAVEAGKHVLCEKPIALNESDMAPLDAALKAHPNVKVMEAFMYRFHPQWSMAKDLLDNGKIGKINSIEAVFTYFNRDPKNVRNMPGIGGGGLLDIGCYCISATRYLLGLEPVRVMGSLSMDGDFQVDRHAHAMLDFGEVRANIYCSTQSEPSQRVYVSGEHGSLLMEFPFYQPDNAMALLKFYHDRQEEVIETEACDHYVKQVDALADAVMHDKAVPTPLSDARNNMKVIDGVFASHEEGKWISL